MKKKKSVTEVLAQPGTICLCLAPRALHLLSTYLQVLHYSSFQICYKISHPLICPIYSSIFVWLTPPPSGSLNPGSLAAIYTMTYESVLMTQRFFGVCPFIKFLASALLPISILISVFPISFQGFHVLIPSDWTENWGNGWFMLEPYLDHL